MTSVTASDRYAWREGGRATRYRRSETAVLEAARRLIARGGFEATTVEALADEAVVGRRSKQCFESKAGVWVGCSTKIWVTSTPRCPPLPSSGSRSSSTRLSHRASVSEPPFSLAPSSAWPARLTVTDLAAHTHLSGCGVARPARPRRPAQRSPNRGQGKDCCHLGATTRADVLSAVKDSSGAFAGHPEPVAKITGELDRLFALYDFPAEHWIPLRTANPVVILSRITQSGFAVGVTVGAPLANLLVVEDGAGLGPDAFEHEAGFKTGDASRALGPGETGGWHPARGASGTEGVQNTSSHLVFGLEQVGLALCVRAEHPSCREHSDGSPSPLPGDLTHCAPLRQPGATRKSWNLSPTEPPRALVSTETALEVCWRLALLGSASPRSW